MKFNIFQFKISREAADRINEVGFEGDLGEFAIEAKITRDVGCFGSERWEPMMASKFNLVAKCEASNLEDVFPWATATVTRLSSSALLTCTH